MLPFASAPRSRSMYLAAILLLALAFLQPAALRAEPDLPTDDATRELLEKSLSVTEIDKEIARIADRRQESETAIRGKELALTVKEAEIRKRSEQAGRVLRSYYMGERSAILGAFLSVRNFNGLLLVMDYFDALFVQDQHTLQSYREQYRKLTADKNALVAEQDRLTEMERELKVQRDRVARLQDEVNGALGASGDADRLRLLIEEMNRYWETAGVAEVNRYFGALADAIYSLPDWAKKQDGVLEAHGLTYTLHLSQDALNQYLRERNEMFNVFAFRFENGLVTAHGKEAGMEIEVSGRYEIVNEPENAMLFHVDDLVFNGLHLPDTTRRDLERRFDLGFYPRQIVPLLAADSVTAENGELTVKLSLRPASRS